MCFYIAVGKNASADGSVMVGRCSDRIANDAQRVLSVPRMTHAPDETIKIPNSKTTIPQVPLTYAYTAAARWNKGTAIERITGGINEFQVSAGATTSGFGLKPEVLELTPRSDTAVGDYMMTLVLQRCKTAREAVGLMGSLTEQYGSISDTYLVADPNEAWMIELYHGTHWAAARLPDDCFLVEANSYRLGEIDPDDTDNFLCDPDLIPFAVKHGLWDPSGGRPFHASRAYSTPDDQPPRGTHAQPHYSLHRVWRGCMLLKPSANLDPFEPTKEYPLFLVPDRKLTPQDLLNVLKDHYQGTELDEYGAQDEAYPTVINQDTGRYRLAPGWGNSRVIGPAHSVVSWLTQSRDWLPGGIGGVFWSGLGRAWASPHIPWYACNTRTPKAFQLGDASAEGSRYMPDSAFWMFATAGNIVNLFYQGTVDLVRPVWERFDSRSFEMQERVEDAARSLWEQDPAQAAEYLTSYSNGLAREALEMAQDVLTNVLTRIAILNHPSAERSRAEPVRLQSYGRS